MGSTILTFTKQSVVSEIADSRSLSREQVAATLITLNNGAARVSRSARINALVGRLQQGEALREVYLTYLEGLFASSIAEFEQVCRLLLAIEDAPEDLNAQLKRPHQQFSRHLPGLIQRCLEGTSETLGPSQFAGLSNLQVQAEFAADEALLAVLDAFAPGLRGQALRDWCGARWDRYVAVVGEMPSESWLLEELSPTLERLEALITDFQEVIATFEATVARLLLINS